MLLLFSSLIVSSLLLSYPSILGFSLLCISQYSLSNCLVNYLDNQMATVVRRFPSFYINRQSLASFIHTKLPEKKQQQEIIWYSYWILWDPARNNCKKKIRLVTILASMVLWTVRLISYSEESPPQN